jgi:DNA polymerase-1
MRNKGLFLPDIITGDDLIQRFKNAFPLLNAYLADGAESAVNRQYIRTADIFGRIRFFERPANIKEEKAIFREAMNFPIQGSSAGMTKYACVLIKKKVEAENWQDKVQFVLSIHDEIITFVREDFAEEWLKVMMGLMEQAGEFILENKLQKAEGGLSDVWTK